MLEVYCAKVNPEKAPINAIANEIYSALLLFAKKRSKIAINATPRGIESSAIINSIYYLPVCFSANQPRVYESAAFGLLGLVIIGLIASRGL